MNVRIALLIIVSTFLAVPSASAEITRGKTRCLLCWFCGNLNYKCQHKRNFRNKLRRDGMQIETKYEEPTDREHPPFPPTMNWYATETLMTKAPRRVLLMPVTNAWDNEQLSEKATRFYNRELQKAGVTDILSLNAARTENDWTRWPWSQWSDPTRTGRVSYPELVEAAQRFQSEAVLYTRITVYKPTEPPMISIKSVLVAPCGGDKCEILWSMDATFDAGDLDIWDRAKQFYVHRTAKHWAREDVTRMEPFGGTRFYGHRLMLVSIDRYLEYCFYEVVKNLRIAIRGLRWPHYYHERDATVKVSPDDTTDLNETFFSKRKKMSQEELKEKALARQKGTDTGPSKSSKSSKSTKRSSSGSKKTSIETELEGSKVPQVYPRYKYRIKPTLFTPRRKTATPPDFSEKDTTPKKVSDGDKHGRG